MKPEPPTYPRPVPNVDFDEDPTLPGTIVYTREDDGTSHERAAKRRRIEANAHAYLRGEGLFILSAGLRGPFDAGWKNPWATTARKRKAAIGVDDRSPKRLLSQSNDRTRAQRVATSVLSQQKEQPVAHQENPFERRIRSSEPLTHDEKVESWLRRNSALPTESFAAPISPSPKRKSAVTSGMDETNRVWTPTKQTITVDSQDLRAPIQQFEDKIVDSFDDSLTQGQQPPLPVDTHAKLQHVLGTENSVNDHYQKQHVRSSSATGGVVEPTRAEEAIISMKRQPFESTNLACDRQSPQARTEQGLRRPAPGQTSMAPPNKISTKQPELRSPTKKPIPSSIHTRETHTVLDTSRQQQVQPEAALKKQEPSISDQLEDEDHNSEDLLKEMEPAKAVEASVQPYSTAVSEILSLKMLPSAQQKPELYQSTSNISSGALLPDVPTDSRPATNDLADDLGVPVEDQETTVVTSVPSQTEREPKNVQLPTVPVKPESVSNEKERQEPHVPQLEEIPRLQDIATITAEENDLSPTRRVTVEGRMSQTNLDGSFSMQSPSYAKKQSKAKSKKASFGPDSVSHSSQGSIKNVLKVQKVDASGGYLKTTPPPSFAKSNSEKKIGFEDRPSPHQSFSRNLALNDTSVAANGLPKSILRHTSSHSSAAAALASTILSPRNRQVSSLSKNSNPEMLASGQNRVASHQAEEDFDIEGALDDLGSFLSTWDAEKESIRVR